MKGGICEKIRIVGWGKIAVRLNGQRVGRVVGKLRVIKKILFVVFLGLICVFALRRGWLGLGDCQARNDFKKWLRK